MSRNVALITGGSRGIGLGIAEALIKEGWSMAINGVRPQDQVQNTINTLRRSKADIIYVQGNIGDDEDRKRILEETWSHFGVLHALINNAGVAPAQRSDLLETTEESYDRVMDINLKGTFFLSQHAANRMKTISTGTTSKQFSIVNISSISATTASINRGEYCISKAGMSMVTQLFATRLSRENIQVYEIRPGIIATDMTGAVKDKYDKLIAEGLTIQNRWGQPEDLGRAVAALLRGDFSYSTGQVFMVDGGLTVSRL